MLGSTFKLKKLWQKYSCYQTSSMLFSVLPSFRLQLFFSTVSLLDTKSVLICPLWSFTQIGHGGLFNFIYKLTVYDAAVIPLTKITKGHCSQCD